jgi:hypothetical protein
VEIEGFRPSQELIERVSALKAKQQGQVEFEKFCNERLRAVNQRYRSLGRSATHAEDYLRTGSLDPYLHDLAWDALVELYRDETALRERTNQLKATQPKDAGDLLELADKHLTGWRPGPLNV